MTAKVYVDVLAVFSREGELIPTAFVWEDGRKYAIDKVSKPERCASRKAGGINVMFYIINRIKRGNMTTIFCHRHMSNNDILFEYLICF